MFGRDSRLPVDLCFWVSSDGYSGKPSLEHRVLPGRNDKGNKRHSDQRVHYAPPAPGDTGVDMEPVVAGDAQDSYLPTLWRIKYQIRLFSNEGPKVEMGQWGSFIEFIFFHSERKFESLSQRDHPSHQSAKGEQIQSVNFTFIITQ